MMTPRAFFFRAVFAITLWNLTPFFTISAAAMDLEYNDQEKKFSPQTQQYSFTLNNVIVRRTHEGINTILKSIEKEMNQLRSDIVFKKDFPRLEGLLSFLKLGNKEEKTPEKPLETLKIQETKLKTYLKTIDTIEQNPCSHPWYVTSNGTISLDFKKDQKILGEIGLSVIPEVRLG